MVKQRCRKSAINTFSSPFGVSGELGLGTASILGGNAGGTPNASSILGAGSTATGPLAAIEASLNTSANPTITALRTGALTTKQHKVIQALAANNGQPLSIPWSSSGNEPSVVAQIRSYGWIKLVKPTNSPTNPKQVVSATYELTPVGKAIAARTGGGGGVTASGVNLTT
jgi:hypothetical protein